MFWDLSGLALITYDRLRCFCYFVSDCRLRGYGFVLLSLLSFGSQTFTRAPGAPSGAPRTPPDGSALPCYKGNFQRELWGLDFRPFYAKTLFWGPRGPFLSFLLALFEPFFGPFGGSPGGPFEGLGLGGFQKKGQNWALCPPPGHLEPSQIAPPYS